MEEIKQDSVDVVIIGAGMAGLAAADQICLINKEFAKAGVPQISYVILEGSERAGGRTMTDTAQPGFLDYGGQYLSPPRMQTYAWAMVERFGLTGDMFQTSIDQKVDSVYEDEKGNVSLFKGNYPVTPDGMRIIGLIEMLVLGVKANLGAPWKSINAKQFDSMSVAEWADANTTDPSTKELLRLAVRAAYSVMPEDISFLHFLHYAATCGSFRAYEDVIDGGDAYRFRKGTNSLVEKLKEAVDAPNRLKLGCKVVSLVQDTGTETATVTVETARAGQRVWVGRYVIAAMAPTASAVIPVWDPPLPEARIRLKKGMPMARTIKGFALFKTRWWAEKFSGYVLSARGPADWIMDNTWMDENNNLQHPALMTFIVADTAVKLGAELPAVREKLILQQFGRLFGGQDAVDANFVAYVDQDWGADPWGKGCPAGCFAPNTLTQELNGAVVGAALTAPHHYVHWAGAETATDWMGGYMNGALQSGIRAAGEVVNRHLARTAAAGATPVAAE